MIYILLISTITLLSYLELFKPGLLGYKKVLLYGVVLLIVMFAGLRHEVGTDWPSYYEFYNNVETAERIEIGYKHLNNLFSNASIPYNIFLLTINFISLFLIYNFIKKNVNLLFISLLIFIETFMYLNLSGIRQALALSIVCFGVNYAIGRKSIKFIITILLASTFHVSAFIALFMYFIPREKQSLTQFYPVIICFGLVYLWLINNSNALSMLETTIFRNISYYAQQPTSLPNIEESYIIGLLRRLIIIILCVLYSFNVNKDKIDERNCNFNYFYNGYIIGFAIFIFTFPSSPDIGTRLAQYFIVFEIVIVSKLAYENKIKNSLVIISAYVLISWYKIFGIIQLPQYQYDSILSNLY